MATATVTLHTYAAASETTRDPGVRASGGGFTAAGSSTPVDVSAYATLRQVVRIDINHGARPQGTVTIQHGPTASGPWTTAWSKRLSTGAQPGNDDTWNSAPRAVFACDAFARLTWDFRGGNEGLALSIGCTGDGVGSDVS